MRELQWYRVIRGTALLLSSVLVLAGCDTRAPAAFGEANSVIIATPDSIWAAVSDTFAAALEPPIFVEREERTFNLTQVAPTEADWADLRKWKRVIVIGPSDAAWVEPVLDEADEPVGDLPAIVEAVDVWAQGQSVSAVVLPPGGGAAEVRAQLPTLKRRMEESFREYTIRRMYVSGVDEALRDTLRREAGFSLTVPRVYDLTREDSAYVFRNDYVAGSDEIRRSVLVTWRSSAADSIRPAEVLDWRERVNERYYEFPQVTRRDPVRARRIEGVGARAVEVQGFWESPEGSWPAAGPFMSRIIACPQQDRTYFVDAWLYAPGEDKYEYALQLQTLLNTFECGT